MCWAIKENIDKKIIQVPYGRLLSEIFHQSGLLKRIKDTGAASDKDMGACTGRILNGRFLSSMKPIEPSEVKILDSDRTESQVMSDLMKDFPPISREDHPIVIAEVVAQHLRETGVEIAREQIPKKADAPLKIIRAKKESDWV